MSKKWLKQQNWSSIVALSIAGFGIGSLVGLSASPTVQTVLAVVLGGTATFIAAIGGVESRNVISGIGKVLSGKQDTLNTSNSGEIVGADGLPLSKQVIDPWPLAIFILLLLIGAGVGLKVRTLNWLGTNSILQEQKVWVQLGFDEKEVNNELYAQRFPMSGLTKVHRLETLQEELDLLVNAGITNTVASQALLTHIYGSHTPNPSTTEVPGVLFSEGALLAGSTEACREIRNMLDTIDLQTALSLSLEKRWQVLSVITDTASLNDIFETDLCPKQ